MRFSIPHPTPSATIMWNQFILLSSLEFTLYQSWIVQPWWRRASSIMQSAFLVVCNGFFCSFNDLRLASWSARLTLLVLATTFKCSLKSVPHIYNTIYLVHQLWWFLGAFLLKAPHVGTHSPPILEHVHLETPNNFDMTHVLRPCWQHS